MKKIKHFVKSIDEELKGAEQYAEKYLEYKLDGKFDLANKYKSMTEDELNHATVLHTQAVEEIENLRSVYTPPADMLEKWQVTHDNYVKNMSYIKSLVAL